MNRGDIYLVSLDPTEEREQRGHRPVLVISPAEFNAATKLPIILPITNGGEFARRIGFFRADHWHPDNGRRSLRSTASAGHSRSQRSQGGYAAADYP